VEIWYQRFVRTALTPAETAEVERVDDLALQLGEHLQASAAEIRRGRRSPVEPRA